MKTGGVFCGHAEEFDPPLDPGIREYVETLRSHGVKTYESCQGGEGHSYPYPAVRFEGGYGEGFRALGIALEMNWRVIFLRRVWSFEDGEIKGPIWELEFVPDED